MRTELEMLDWSDVREAVQKVNPRLVNIIDNLKLSPQHKLIKATYAFGDLIVKEGHLCLPIQESKLYTQLNYSPIPLSLLLNKSSEVFVQNHDSALPLNRLQPGNFFGTFEAVNFMMHKPAASIWHVSAGARSIFMLPKISDLSGIKRLRAHYPIAHNLHLRSLSDHWSLFRQITQKPLFDFDWKSEVLFFPKVWLINKSPAWYPFYNLMWEAMWNQAQYAMTDFNFRNEWQSCLTIIDQKRLKPSPYIMDTVKHLLHIIRGVATFFSPTANSEISVPLSELQHAFTDIYRLEHYQPTIMSPALFNIDEPSIGYYSLAFPALISGAHPVKSASFMPDLKMIKLIMDYLSENSPALSPLAQTLLGYFHSAKDKFQDVLLSTEIPNRDLDFIQEYDKFPDRRFCAASPFWRGCIQIRSKA